LVKKVLAYAPVDELTTTQAEMVKATMQGKGVLVARYGHKCLIVAMPQQAQEFRTVSGDEKFVRYHACSFEAWANALSKGNHKLAAGWSTTAKTFGLYVSDTAEGALFYSHAKASGLCALSVLFSKYAGKNVGKSGSKTNRCLRYPFDHVIVGTILFPSKGTLKTEQPHAGDQYPMHFTTEEAKKLTSSWPAAYLQYVQESFGLDDDLRFLHTSPVVQ
jgi:hypothetical protein